MRDKEETPNRPFLEQRLKEIASEYYGFGNFNLNTMSRVERRAIEVRSWSIVILGEEDEVTAEMDSAILISKNYHRKSLGLENDIIKEAIIHLEYGIGLFLEKI